MRSLRESPTNRPRHLSLPSHLSQPLLLSPPPPTTTTRVLTLTDHQLAEETTIHTTSCLSKSNNYLPRKSSKKIDYKQPPINSSTSKFSIKNFIHHSGPLILFYLTSMSLYYQVMGTQKCPKWWKKHAGLTVIPVQGKPKSQYTTGDLLVFRCESIEFKQTIKCLEDGRWSEMPDCPDPSNNTCPDLLPFDNGSHKPSSGPYKVGSIVTFSCNSAEQLQTSDGSSPQQSTGDAISSRLSITTPTALRQYNLTGPATLKCLPSSKWNNIQPTCEPIMPKPVTNLSFWLGSMILILIPILIILLIVRLFIRWRKKQQQRERWKQYFTDYKYRHSKTSIAFETGNNQQISPNTIPVTDL